MNTLPATRPSRAWRAVLASILLVAWLSHGCATSGGRAAYNTLAGAGRTVDTAVAGYYAAVVAGVVPTNDVPRVSRAYGEFQILFRAALEVAKFQPGPDTNVMARATALMRAVAEAKGGTP